MLIKKCKNTSGASIFIALLFLLMCSLVGSVVLTAASTSSGRLVNLKRNEQSYYTLVSAARLLKKEIVGEKYSRYQVVSSSGDILEEGYNEVPQKGIKDLLQQAADQVFESKSAYKDSWTIAVSESVIEEIMAQVSIDEKYNMSIQLFEGDRRYTLSIPAILSESEEEIINEDTDLISTKTRKTTTVIWAEGEIRKN